LLCWLLLLLSKTAAGSVAGGMVVEDEEVAEVALVSGSIGKGDIELLGRLVGVASMSDVTCAVIGPAHKRSSSRRNVK
jgi:fructose-specific component phosphotransferase system IIB-like protein